MTRSYTATIYHPVGTGKFLNSIFFKRYLLLNFIIFFCKSKAKMGPPDDPMAVVDPQLRVYGVSGLRYVIRFFLYLKNYTHL